MAVFNSAKREINIKIVYYGPAQCGKTTNVQNIHKKLAPHQRGELISLATKDDRTLFFDFLPIELGNVKGFKTRFHIYTVPGQVYYALTRRAVLTNVDGVVFVADSQTDKMDENIESINDLRENLKYYQKELPSFPFVIQYNKRDLPDIVSVPTLNTVLNTLHVPCFEASAINGSGVMETLTACCKLVLKQLDAGATRKEGPIVRIFAEPSSPDMHEIPTVSAATPSPGEGTVEKTQPGMDIPDKITDTEPPAVEQPVALPDTQPEPHQLKKDEPSMTMLHDSPMVEEKRSEAVPPLEVSAQIGTDADAPLKIIACGQPQKESPSSIKIPLILKIEGLNKECLVNLIIKFDNVTLREPH